MPARNDPAMGTVFGSRTVISECWSAPRFDRPGQTRRYVKVQCTCGRVDEVLVLTLRGGHASHCRDCKNREQAERQRKPYSYDRILVYKKQGYKIWAWDHPHRTRVNVPEHRIVMEGLIGRELLPEEEVHHKNTVRSDNTPENLELWNHGQPKGGRVEDLVTWAQHILELYT